MSDILIIGGGPAGLTAAIYALRYGYSASVFEAAAFGGQVVLTAEVDNYPGVANTSGYALAMAMYKQAEELGAEFIPERVIGISANESVKTVVTENGRYDGAAIIIANGAKRRKLDCPGEGKLSGRGVSYCATCDGAFFRGKDVAIVGGGNTALEDAIFLSKGCAKVYLIHRRDGFRGNKSLVDAVKQNPKIEILYNAQLTEIVGEKVVEQALVVVGEDARTLAVSGVFIAVGTEPDNGFLDSQLKLSKDGYICSNEDCKTIMEGVFVAGDSRVKKLRQIVTATADGAAAAFMAASFLGNQKL